jgi:transketolase
LTNEFGLPLAIHSDMDKLIMAYDSNKIAVFDTINKRLHPWTLQNMDKMPENFLRRYNRIVGIT